MNLIKEEFNRYKWILLTGVIVSVLIGLIAANFHVIKFIGHKLNNDSIGMIEILENHVKNKSSQSEWYFTSGITELLSQKEWPEETHTFMDSNFQYFNSNTQLEVIDGYNRKKMFLTTSKELMSNFISMLDNKTVQDYIKRMSPEELENGLIMFYGKTPEMNQKFIDEIYNVLSIYPNKIPFVEFKFDLKQILSLKGEENNAKKIAIFEGIDPKSARQSVMESFKNESITGEELKYCVEFLNQTEILDNATYIKFNDIYSQIFVLEDKFKELEITKVELENQREAIEVQIGQSLVNLETKSKEINSLDSEIANIDAELDKLTNYAYMALYIEKQSGTGHNEYEASIPRKGIFGDYKPSNQKYIVKLSQTGFLVEGVYYLDIYMNGTKTNNRGNEYPYYEEVSETQINNIANFQAQRQEKASQRDRIQTEINSLEVEVDKIKKDMGYDENENNLKEMAIQKEDITKQLNEKVVEIKKMFGLSNLKIDVKQ